MLNYLQLLQKPADFLQRPVSAISGGEAQIVAVYSFYLGISIDPIKLISAFQERPRKQARWQEVRQQKRLAIIRLYFAYIQARQAKKIAAYRMQLFTKNECITIANSDYVAAATEMLNTSAKEQIALEELAANVGLS